MYKLLTEEKKLCQSLVGSFRIVLEYKNQSDTRDYRRNLKSHRMIDLNNPNS